MGSNETKLDFNGALRLCALSCGHERDVERLRIAEDYVSGRAGCDGLGWLTSASSQSYLRPPGASRNQSSRGRAASPRYSLPKVSLSQAMSSMAESLSTTER